MRDYLAVKDRELLSGMDAESSVRNIFSAMYSYFLGLSRDKSDIPLALVVSKADLFGFAELPFFDDKPQSRIQNLLPGEDNAGYLNAGGVRALNSEVRELLKYLSEEQVLNNALGCFKNVSCFSVSSLGKKPVTDGEKMVVPGKAEPFRVKEPFYWILRKNGLFLNYEATEKDASDEASPPQKEKLGLLKAFLKKLNIFSKKQET
ncbi:hypothetical protein FACS189490_08670 [Clostridia bacterium]|nr:hypothetical protein FACS189490_08670 [Clostridia bacterium]